MDKILNSKTRWIDSLLIVSTMNNEETKVTFITNFGYVVGRKFEPINLDFTDEKTTEETIANALKEGNAIDNISATEAFFSTLFEKDEKDGYKYEATNRRIFIKDAKIFAHNNLNNPLNCEMLVLFSDQIVGVIPGEMMSS